MREKENCQQNDFNKQIAKKKLKNNKTEVIC